MTCRQVAVSGAADSRDWRQTNTVSQQARYTVTALASDVKKLSMTWYLSRTDERNDITEASREKIKMLILYFLGGTSKVQVFGPRIPSHSIAASSSRRTLLTFLSLFDCLQVENIWTLAQKMKTSAAAPSQAG